MKYSFLFTFCLSLLCLKVGYSQEAGIQSIAGSSIMSPVPDVKGKPSGKFGIVLTGGFSRITDSGYPLKNTADTTITWSCIPSAQIGCYGNFYFGKHFVLTIEPGFSLIQGRARLKTNLLGAQYFDELWKRMLFASLPLTCGVHFGNLEIDLGIQPSLMVYGQTQEKHVYVTPNYSIPRGESDQKRIKANPFDMGIKGEVSYRFIKRVSLMVNIYYGLLDINRNTSYAPDVTSWKVRQLTVGVKNSLW